LLEDFLVFRLFVELHPSEEEVCEASKSEYKVDQDKRVAKIWHVPGKEVNTGPTISARLTEIVLALVLAIDVVLHDQVAVEKG